LKIVDESRKKVLQQSYEKLFLRKLTQDEKHSSFFHYIDGKGGNFTTFMQKVFYLQWRERKTP
jgi:hypothetical protein